MSRFAILKSKPVVAMTLLGLAAVAFSRTGNFTSNIPEQPSLVFTRAGLHQWETQASNYRATVSSSGVSIAAGGGTLAMAIQDANQNAGTVSPSSRVGQLVIPGVLPGVDAIYHGESSNLEFDFLVAPGSDPERIKMAWTGAESLKIQASGDLTLRSGTAEVTVLRPRAWQETKRGRTGVQVAYKLKANTLAFELGSYDPALALRIDPTILVSLPVESIKQAQPRVSLPGQPTSLAALPLNVQELAAGRAAHTMAFGSDGALYLAGRNHAWVSKLNAARDAEQFRTYLGHDARDSVDALAVDSRGNAHVAGSVFASDAAQGFAAVLDNTGERTQYTAYPAPVRSLALGSAGELYLAGDDFVLRDGGWKIAPPGPVRALAVDAAGRLYAAGQMHGDAFVAKLSVEGQQPRWQWVLSLGGVGTSDEARSLAIARDGSIYLAGLTNSPDFPVKAAFQDRMAGVQDGFVARISPDGSGTLWATYLGGHATTAATAISLDAAGRPMVAGFTDSRDFPLAGTGSGHQDGFFARFDTAGTLLESSYLGALGTSRLFALASASNGETFVAGSSTTGVEDVVAAHVTQTGLSALAAASPASGTSVSSVNHQARPVRAQLAGATATTTTLTVTPSPAVYGTSVTLTATVSPSTATGLATFYAGAAVLGESTLTGGVAKLNTIALPAGSSSLTAFYGGNATFASSTSTAKSETVNAGAGTTFATSNNSPFNVGSTPAAVAVGDINGDGKADLAVANFGDNTVTVLLNDGHGNFTPSTGSPISVGVNPVSVAIVDFNGDGKADMAIANFGDNTVTVLLGNGTGGFTAAVGSPLTLGPRAVVPAGGGPRSLAVADFNRDGFADLAVANFGTGDVTILLGNGAGGFTASSGSPFAVGSNPFSIVAGDFNGDGKTDLVVDNQGSNNVSVLVGDGTGNFTQPVSAVTVGAHPNSVTVGDFNGDGKLDLAVANFTDNTVSVLLGNGNATFTAAAGSPISVGTHPYSVTTGDFNGDGHSDIAVTDSGSADVTVLLGSGTGTFTVESGSPFPVGGNPVAMAVGEFNSDGRADLAVVNLGSGNVTVLQGVGPAAQLAITQQPSTGTAGLPIQNVKVQVEDSGGNLVTSSTASITIISTPAGVSGTTTVNAVGGVAVFNSLVFGKAATYTLTASATGLTSASGGPLVIGPAPASQLVITSQPTTGVTGAPLANVVVQVQDPGGNLVTTSTATVTMTSIPPGVTGTTSVQASGGIATFSNLIFTSGGTYTLTAASTGLSGATSNPITVGTGTASKLAITAQPTTGVAGTAIGSVTVQVEDMAGNLVTGSTATIAMASTPAGVTGTLSVKASGGIATFSNLVFPANGSYTLTASSTGLLSATSAAIAIVPASTTTVKASANPATYGVPVTLTATVTPATATGSVTFYAGTAVLGVGTLSGGTATLSTIGLPAGVTLLTARYAGDANDGGSLSPAVSETVNATGSAGFGPAVGSPFSVGNSPASVTVADMNADGKADMAIANFSDNTVSVLVGDGTGNFTASGTPVAVGTNPVSVAVGDFNGDGKADMAVANFGDNTVTVLLGNGAGGFTAAIGSPYTVGNPAKFIATGGGPRSVAIGDFNGDGFADLAVADFGSDEVTVLLGNGAGGFTAATGSPFAAGSNPFSLAIADFNKDGRADIVVANQAGNNVTVLLGDGSGGFTPAPSSPFAVGHHPNSVTVGDFNGDGSVDLAVANLTDSTVTVLLGNGSGGFTTAPGSPFAVGTSPYSVAAGDFNGDGHLDLATANSSSTDVTVLIGTGNGAFTPQTGSPYPAGGSPVAIAVGGFTGDGRAGLAIANLGSNNITVLLGVMGGGATKLQITSQPTTGTTGTPIANVIVQVEDANGNLVTGSTATVTVTSTPTGVSGTLSVNAVGGVATFSNLVFNTANSYTLSFASSGLVGAASTPITISTSGGAAKLAITSQPTTGTAGTTLGNVVVKVEDSNGVVVTGSSAAVTIASSPAGVSGTLTVNAVNGVATFSNLLFTKAVKATLTASSPGLTSATSSTITINPGPATLLKITGPVTGTAGKLLGKYSVQVQDNFGNIVTNSSAAITIAPNGPGPFKAGSTTTVNAVRGMASFTNLELDKAGSYTLTVSSPGLTSATTGTLTINPAAATTLVFAQQPVNGKVNVKLPLVKVQVQDSFGNPIKSSASIKMTANGPAGFTAGSTTTVAAVNGNANFNNLILATAGTYTMTASSTGLTSATSNSFSVQ